MFWATRFWSHWNSSVVLTAVANNCDLWNESVVCQKGWVNEARDGLAMAVSTGGTLILSCMPLYNGVNASMDVAGLRAAPPPPLALFPQTWSPIMDNSTCCPHDEHFIVGMKLDSLGAPAIFGRACWTTALRGAA